MSKSSLAVGDTIWYQSVYSVEKPARLQDAKIIWGGGWVDENAVKSEEMESGVGWMSGMVVV